MNDYDKIKMDLLLHGVAFVLDNKYITIEEARDLLKQGKDAGMEIITGPHKSTRED